MAKNRYAKDYRIVETWDARGRVKVASEYIGKPYRFQEDAQCISKEKAKLLLLCVLGWAGFLGALILYSESMRRLYVALPFVFTAIPLTVLTDIVFSFRKMKEPLEHRHEDRMNNRYPFVSVMTAILGSFSLGGAVVNLLAGGHVSAGDYVFFLGDAAVILAGTAAFRDRKKVLVIPGTAK